MDAFDDAFGESPVPVKTESNGNGNGLLDEESDPAAEFLAREQSNFAGLEDEIPEVGGAEVSNGNVDVSNSNGNVMDDDFGLLGVGADNNGLGNGNGGDDDFLSQARAATPEISSAPSVTIQREEPEKIRIWREEQKQRLEVKDREEEENKEKLREAAKKELEEWYKNYDEQVVKTRNSNRTAEQEGAAVDTSPTETGKEWERIANLCDFNPKSSKQQKDISRMRSLILQLKQNPPAPRRQSSAGNSIAS